MTNQPNIILEKYFIANYYYIIESDYTETLLYHYNHALSKWTMTLSSLRNIVIVVWCMKIVTNSNTLSRPDLSESNVNQLWSKSYVKISGYPKDNLQHNRGTLINVMRRHTILYGWHNIVLSRRLIRLTEVSILRY